MVIGLQLPFSSLPLGGMPDEHLPMESETIQPLSFGELLKLKEKQLQQEQQVSASLIAAAFATLQTSIVLPLPLLNVEFPAPQLSVDGPTQPSDNSIQTPIASTATQPTTTQFTSTGNAAPIAQPFPVPAAESAPQPAELSKTQTTPPATVDASKQEAFTGQAIPKDYSTTVAFHQVAPKPTTEPVSKQVQRPVSASKVEHPAQPAVLAQGMQPRVIQIKTSAEANSSTVFTEPALESQPKTDVVTTTLSNVVSGTERVHEDQVLDQVSFTTSATSTKAQSPRMATDELSAVVSPQSIEEKPPSTKANGFVVKPSSRPETAHAKVSKPAEIVQHVRQRVTVNDSGVRMETAKVQDELSRSSQPVAAGIVGAPDRKTLTPEAETPRLNTEVQQPIRSGNSRAPIQPRTVVQPTVTSEEITGESAEFTTLTEPITKEVPLPTRTEIKARAKVNELAEIVQPVHQQVAVNEPSIRLETTQTQDEPSPSSQPASARTILTSDRETLTLATETPRSNTEIEQPVRNVNPRRPTQPQTVVQSTVTSEQITVESPTFTTVTEPLPKEVPLPTQTETKAQVIAAESKKLGSQADNVSSLVSHFHSESVVIPEGNPSGTVKPLSVSENEPHVTAPQTNATQPGEKKSRLPDQGSKTRIASTTSAPSAAVQREMPMAEQPLGTRENIFAASVARQAGPKHTEQSEIPEQVIFVSTPDVDQTPAKLFTPREVTSATLSSDTTRPEQIKSAALAINDDEKLVSTSYVKTGNEVVPPERRASLRAAEAIEEADSLNKAMVPEVKVSSEKPVFVRMTDPNSDSKPIRISDKGFSSGTNHNVDFDTKEVQVTLFTRNETIKPEPRVEVKSEVTNQPHAVRLESRSTDEVQVAPRSSNKVETPKAEESRPELHLTGKISTAEETITAATPPADIKFEKETSNAVKQVSTSTSTNSGMPDITSTTKGETELEGSTVTRVDQLTQKFAAQPSEPVDEIKLPKVEAAGEDAYAKKFNASLPTTTEKPAFVSKTESNPTDKAQSVLNSFHVTVDKTGQDVAPDAKTDKETLAFATTSAAPTSNAVIEDPIDREIRNQPTVPSTNVVAEAEFEVKLSETSTRPVQPSMNESAFEMEDVSPNSRFVVDHQKAEQQQTLDLKESTDTVARMVVNVATAEVEPESEESVMDAHEATSRPAVVSANTNTMVSFETGTESETRFESKPVTKLPTEQEPLPTVAEQKPNVEMKKVAAQPKGSHGIHIAQSGSQTTITQPALQVVHNAKLETVEAQVFAEELQPISHQQTTEPQLAEAKKQEKQVDVEKRSVHVEKLTDWTASGDEEVMDDSRPTSEESKRSVETAHVKKPAHPSEKVVTKPVESKGSVIDVQVSTPRSVTADMDQPGKIIERIVSRPPESDLNNVDVKGVGQTEKRDPSQVQAVGKSASVIEQTPVSAEPAVKATLDETVGTRHTASRHAESRPIEEPPEPNQMPGATAAATGLVHETKAAEFNDKMPVGQVHAQATDVVQQVVRQINSRIKSGSTSMRLQLNPQELGGIEVELVSSSHGVQVTFFAEQASTGRLLETQLNQLRDSLVDSGVQLSGLNIGHHNMQGQKGGTFSQDTNFAPFTQQGFVESHEEDVPRAERRIGQSSEVDYRI